MRVLLLSTYELGHQPLHLASPAGALQGAGHEVRCVDLGIDQIDAGDVAWSEVVAVSVPMHTAMRLAHRACEVVRRLRPGVPVCFFGLYAAMDDGADRPGRPDLSIAGEYEPELLSALDRLGRGASDAFEGRHVALGRHHQGLPARRLLPPLHRYARLVLGDETRLAGYVEASHGCAHRCRHCPVPVVYDGRIRIVDVESVMADVAQLVGMGARHVSFGDPDFLNGPAHSRRVVSALHGAFPDLTFDVTAKVSHVLSHRRLWPEMAAAGCLFVVSAFESASDVVLSHLDKGHSAADEMEAVAVLRAAGIEPRPSLMPFTPWTAPGDIGELLALVERCDLVGNVDPVQFSIRLLVPPGSLLLDSGDLDGRLDAYDPDRLGWTWRSADPRLDRLQLRLGAVAEEAADGGWDAVGAHDEIRRAVAEVLGPGLPGPPCPADPAMRSSLAPDHRPRLSEAWFCCAEPTDGQMGAAAATVVGAPS